MSTVVVDCEAFGGSPATGRLTEFGAVISGGNVEVEPHCERCAASRRPWFHGVIVESVSGAAAYLIDSNNVFRLFDEWLATASRGRPVFWSDNPAFDWQWINCGFWQHLGRNPFGHSARRISDFYAGLRGDPRRTQDWKRLRKTKHDHNPVHDAIGNAEALEVMMAWSRGVGGVVSSTRIVVDSVNPDPDTSPPEEPPEHICGLHCSHESHPRY